MRRRHHWFITIISITNTDVWLHTVTAMAQHWQQTVSEWDCYPHTRVALRSRHTGVGIVTPLVGCYVIGHRWQRPLNEFKQWLAVRRCMVTTIYASKHHITACFVSTSHWSFTYCCHCYDKNVVERAIRPAFGRSANKRAVIAYQ